MRVNPKLIGLALSLAFLFPSPARAQFFGSCAEDDRIDLEKRIAIENASLLFVNLLLSGGSQDAYKRFTSEGQASQTMDQFIEGVDRAIRPVALKNVRVTKTYLVSVRGSSPIRVVCGILSGPETWASVTASDSPEQAHVVIEGQGVNNVVGFALWLLPEKGEWRIHAFYFNAVSLADKRADEIWRLARAEKSHSHLLNATLLYATASQLASPGPTIQPGILQTIREEMGDLSIPLELQGRPPFIWKATKATKKEFRVLTIGPIAVGGSIYLRIVHEIEPWKSDEEPESQNRQLMAHFVLRFPEYSHVFAGLVVHASERGGNRMWGTVEDFLKK